MIVHPAAQLADWCSRSHAGFKSDLWPFVAFSSDLSLLPFPVLLELLSNQTTERTFFFLDANTAVI